MATSSDLKDARRRIEQELETALDPERLKRIIDVALSTGKNAWGTFLQELREASAPDGEGA